jgi:hypothetical protein
MKNRARASAILLVLSISNPVLEADQVLTWNAIMLSTVAGQNPFAQARFATIAQLAVFEAVNAVTGNYKPYFGTITAPAGASAEAAAVAAMRGVLKNYFPGSTATLDAARTADFRPGHFIALGRGNTVRPRQWRPV